jgi:hypothetical protein
VIKSRGFLQNTASLSQSPLPSPATGVDGASPPGSGQWPCSGWNPLIPAPQVRRRQRWTIPAETRRRARKPINGGRSAPPRPGGRTPGQCCADEADAPGAMYVICNTNTKTKAKFFVCQSATRNDGADLQVAGLGSCWRRRSIEKDEQVPCGSLESE